MKYIQRLINILYIIVRAIFLGLMHLGVMIMLGVQKIISFSIIFPIALIFQVLEYVLWFGIYYIATGKNYYDDYNPILSVCCEFLQTKKIVFKKNEKIYPCEGWYDTIYDKLLDFKIIKKIYSI
jgi:hypothetical protein